MKFDDDEVGNGGVVMIMVRIIIIFISNYCQPGGGAGLIEESAIWPQLEAMLTAQKNHDHNFLAENLNRNFFPVKMAHLYHIEKAI